ncbi:hypothetical protein GO988_21605 [Hymenobacter sp. HMF4947]|uniref:Uncharacterized protein n=1 Tax=Hymenobacter ginkgonis TaxID=2682976 RepID=A0A7K1TKJ1_9BACT|nr:hypothetical protein [Hymenobacter ginkgonis]MVN78934.1 hypothetical protein [Hymenobacter ginkgonis]
MLPTYNPIQHVPPTPPMPTLTVTPKGVLYLHTSLREKLGLRDGMPINLVPPNPNIDDYYWHLDLRSTAKHRIVWYDNTRMRARGIQLPPGLVTQPLTLHLYTATPEHPGYYPMLAAHALAT